MKGMVKDIRVWRRKSDAQGMADVLNKRSAFGYKVACLRGGGYIVARSGSVLVAVEK